MFSGRKAHFPDLVLRIAQKKRGEMQARSPNPSGGGLEQFSERAESRGIPKSAKV